MPIIVMLMLLFGFTAFASSPPPVQTIVLKESNTIVMNSAFNDLSVSKLSAELYKKVQVDNPPTEIYLVMDTPGGSVTAGQQFIDTAKALGVKVHTITIFSASMGYNTVQSMTGKRYITPSGTLMSHRATLGGIGGQIPGELNTRLKLYETIIGNIERVTAARVGISIEEYNKLIKDEYWVVGEDAVKAGHADSVVNVVCDPSISGNRTEEVSFMGFVFEVQFSNCPMITGPLGIAVKFAPYSTTGEELDMTTTKFKETFNHRSNIQISL